MAKYLLLSPAGSLMGEDCVATGHKHTGPDVELAERCAVHHQAWVFCGGCQEIWCPGMPNQNNGHEGTVMPIAQAQPSSLAPLANGG